MKIDINKPGSRGFCDEVVYIKTNYIRVHSNPGRTAKTVTNYLAIRIIGFLIVAVVALDLAISKQDMIYMAIAAVMAIALVAVFLSYRGYRKQIFELMDDDSPKTLEIAEDYVSYVANGEELRYSWDEINCVAINKRSVTFFPKRYKDTKPIFVDIEYKDQVIQALKEIEHGYLIEDNVSREAD